jgi:hypothetical protein
LAEKPILQTAVIAMSVSELGSEESRREERPGVAAAVRPAPSSPTNDDSEQSIEQYMMGLLARVGNLTNAAKGEPSPQDRQGADKRQMPAPPSTPGQTAAAVQTDRELSVARSSRDEPAEISPRQHCPVSADGLSTMRELANLNARAAVMTHSVKQLVIHARRTLATAAAAMLASFVAMRSAVAGQPLAYAFAVLGMFVVLACCWQYFRITEVISRKPLTDSEEMHARSKDDGVPGSAGTTSLTPAARGAGPAAPGLG